jgi:hypothetical protein
VLGRAGLKTRTKAADHITGDQAIAPILVCLKATCLTDAWLPGTRQLGGVPRALRQSRPAAPDGIRRKPKIGASRDDGPPALQQAAAEPPPQQMAETQMGTERPTSDHTRQNTIDTVEYGGQQGKLLQGDEVLSNLTFPADFLVSPYSLLCTGK